MFLGCSLYCVIIIIKYWWGLQHCFRFRLKITSCAWFFGSGLKLIFNWKAHLFIFTKSLFNSKAEVLLSWITEKKFQLLANSLTFEGNPFDKLLIYIKNNIIDQVLRPYSFSLQTNHQAFPFYKSLYFLFHKRFSIDIKDLRDSVNYQIYHFVLI